MLPEIAESPGYVGIVGIRPFGPKIQGMRQGEADRAFVRLGPMDMMPPDDVHT